MSFAQVSSAQNVLLEARIIDIEVDLAKGLNAFTIVGLPDKAVEEAKDRVSAAIKNIGLESPKTRNQKVVISLAPADLKKEGPIFDLAIALGYLLASEQIKFSPEKKLFLGELSLNGQLRPLSGALPLVREARRLNFAEVYLPQDNAREAALVPGIKIFGVSHLKELIAHLDIKDKDAEDIFELKSQAPTKIERQTAEPEIDFSDIKGQESAKRGLEIAAAGGHNLAMWGPPGTGKTMLAKAFSFILPPLDFEEVLEITGIHSVAGRLRGPLLVRPPFRSPHHTASYAALIGGGATPKPGEVTLAHKGVLFLDEFPEFDRRVIEALRQPLEERTVSVARTKASALFPADFILIAAMNPCPCGNFGVKGKTCVCLPSHLARYRRKLSGPLIDRIDLWMEVSQVDYQKLSQQSGQSQTEKIRQRVCSARERQAARFKSLGLECQINSQLKAKQIMGAVNLSEGLTEKFNDLARRLELSARSYHRLLKVARTIADLEEAEAVTESHLLEALQYRPKPANGLYF